MATHMDSRGRNGQIVARVLVVEDDADYAMLLCDAVEHCGMAMEAVGTVREALLRDPDSYDSIILDHCLPDGTGLDVLAKITGRSLVPVIVLTGEDDVETAVSALKAGAHSYLIKTPENLESIGEIVRQTVGVGQLLRKHRAQHEAMRRADYLAGVSTLVAGLCHEMNNPLAGIIGHGDLFLRGMEEDAVAAVEGMMVGARRIRDVVKSLTAFATGDVPPLDEIDIAAVVRSEIEVQSEAFARSGVRVLFEAPELPVHVRANGSSLRQVASHLLNNARRAMEGCPEKCLTVRLQRSFETVVIEFEDTGPGVPPHLREKIFQPFYTTLDPNEGMGMGLPICHGIVSRQGGRIWCSRGSTGGAMFVVEMPSYRDVAPSFEPDASIL